MGIATIVRHGQASFDSENYDQLSDIGFEQSRLLGTSFFEKKLTFNRIYCGTLTRHKQTLQGIIEGMAGTMSDISIQESENLNEFQFKDIIRAYLIKHALPMPEANAPRQAFYRLLKLAMTDWQSGALDSFDIVETWSVFEARVSTIIEQITGLNGKNVLVVTSGGVIGTMLKTVLNAPDDMAIALNLQIRNASTSKCIIGKNRMSLMEFNNVACFEKQGMERFITYS